MSKAGEFQFAAMMARLEAAVDRLETAMRTMPVGSEPQAGSEAEGSAGEAWMVPSPPPSPQASTHEPTAEEMAQALEWIEKAQWRAEALKRKFEAQGGPNDEDVEAYLDAWKAFR